MLSLLQAPLNSGSSVSVKTSTWRVALRAWAGKLPGQRPARAQAGAERGSEFSASDGRGHKGAVAVCVFCTTITQVEVGRRGTRCWGPLDTPRVHPRSQEHQEKPGGLGAAGRRDGTHRRVTPLQAAGWAPAVPGRVTGRGPQLRALHHGAGGLSGLWAPAQECSREQPVQTNTGRTSQTNMCILVP